MGSSGSGNFSDYSGREKQQNGDGTSGGGSGEDKCRQAFSVGLEDVGLYDHYSNNGNVPSPGAVLSITLNKRVIAVDANGLSVGALPTSFNYLAGCLREGINYTGVVISSSSAPVPQVDVDFVPVN